MLKEFYQVIHHVVKEEERAAVAYISGLHITNVNEADINKAATESILAKGLPIAKTEEVSNINKVYGALKEVEYTPENWILIGTIKDTAIGAVNAAITISSVISTSNKAVNDMLAVKKV